MKDSEDWFKLDFFWDELLESGTEEVSVDGAQSQSKGTLGELGGGQSG